jgi:uncharacterized delta-60 repeat protein
MTINAVFNPFMRKFLHGGLALGLALSTLGAARLPASHLSSSDCHTQEVRITLAGEQIRFCTPTGQAFNIVEDNTSDPYVSYAGLNQIEGYGIVNIKATIAGYTPGPGRPVYTSGEAAAYRQAVWELETSKTDRVVSDGPTAVFWDETVTSMQMDLMLPLSSGDLQVRSLEWYVEHAGRLWSFILTWDTGMSNAAEWEQASKNFSIQKTAGGKIIDTALDLGAAFLETQSTQAALPSSSPVPVGAPAWWSGVCDDNNYFAFSSHHSTILSTWLGVSACGPIPTHDRPVTFFTGAWGQYEFECVELVMRFLYLEWGIKPFNGNGNTIKNYYPTNSMVFYPNGTPFIVSGDVITENGDGSYPNSVGHTMIVTGVSLDSVGTGTISILEQNSSNKGSRTLHVTTWSVDPDPYTWGRTIQGWLHAKVNQPGPDPDGGVDGTFVPGTGSNNIVDAIALQPGAPWGGKFYIAGEFTQYNGTTFKQIARLNNDGTLDSSFNPGEGVTVSGSETAYVFTLAVQTDGKLLIGGNFDSFNGVERNHIARLNSNGSLDTTFIPAPEINDNIYKIVVQPDGQILVGGEGLLRRLNSNGTLDGSFAGTITGTAGNSIYDLALQSPESSDWKIIVGGVFSKVDNTARAGIARLNKNGTLDTTFNPGTGTGTDGVASIALQADGRILIGGNFTTYNGTSRYRIARLNSDGTLDGTFDPGTGVTGTDKVVQIVVPQTDGRILIGGDFTSYSGIAVNYLVRLNNDGSRDNSFYAQPDNTVMALVLQPDGKIIIGGDFTNHIARLRNHVEPCYTITANATPSAGGTATIGTAPNCPVGKYISGTSVQVTVTLNPDYYLNYWSGGATGESNPLSLTMDGNKSLTANLLHSPGFFNKLSPGNGAADQPANPTLRWETSTDATSYEYCTYTTVSLDCDESSANWISTGVNTSVTLGNLLPSITYHWMVRARNRFDTTRGGPDQEWSFTRNGIPAVPVPVSPAGLVLVDRPPSFIWYASAGATTYNLVVYSVTTASGVIDEVITSPDCLLGVCKKTYSVGTLPVGSYQFKVAAKTDAGLSSSFSAWKDFRVMVGSSTFLPLVTR